MFKVNENYLKLPGSYLFSTGQAGDQSGDWRCHTAFGSGNY